MASTKGRPTSKDKKQVAATEANGKELAAVILVVILAGIPFALGRYFEFSYPDPFDSASNVYSAQHILDGARIGIEERSSAALGTLLVNILGVWLFGFSEFGPKLIQTICQAGALVAVYMALRKLMGRLPAAVAVTVASIYISSPLVAKFGNVKEQYMIACMATAISLFVLRQLGGGWWYSFLAGAIVSWAPLFKETGSSAIGAIGLFVILQPIFRHRTWKQTGIDIALLLAGAVTVMAPLYIWILGWDVQTYTPYWWVTATIKGLLPKPESAAQAGTYISSLRETIPFSQQYPKVLRYYLALCLPVSLAVGSIIVRIGKIVLNLFRKGSPVKVNYDRFVLLFAVWWILDMAFVWISPASYEQYYLPLTASGAITGSYLIAVYRDKLNATVFRLVLMFALWCLFNIAFALLIPSFYERYYRYLIPLSITASIFLIMFYRDKLNATSFKTKLVVVGLIGLVAMIVMSWHIFFGLPRSPYTGVKYPEKRNGYAQRWREIHLRRTQGYRGAWEVAGEYIRNNSKPTDKIYVWGWVPGIYLSAQRFSPSAVAFESEMHARPPEQLEQVIDELLSSFGKEMPKYIVDSRKQHLPLDRFKFELWPIVPKGFMGFAKTEFLPSDPQVVAEFEKQWAQITRERFGDNEVRRFEVMGKFRKFIRENYDIVQMFGDVVVFKLKTEPAQKGT
jgi:4-amino-4-deoxy-L-arabinose transferase-like glycosyltransferase